MISELQYDRRIMLNRINNNTGMKYYPVEYSGLDYSSI